MEANEPLFEQNVNQQQRLGHLANVTRTCWFASINVLKCMINLPGYVGGRVTQVPVRFCSDPSTNVIDRSGKLWNGRTLETLSNESGIIWNFMGEIPWYGRPRGCEGLKIWDLQWGPQTYTVLPTLLFLLPRFCDGCLMARGLKGVQIRCKGLLIRRIWSWFCG